MEFIIKEYKIEEFVSMLSSCAQEGKYNMAQVEIDPNDQADGMTKITIQSNVAKKLSQGKYYLSGGLKKKPTRCEIRRFAPYIHSPQN